MGKRRSRLEEDVGEHMFSPVGAAYQPVRDGSLLHYLIPQIDNGCVQRLFYGLDQFNLLKNEGWILPGTTYLRFMYNLGRGDAHYLVTDDWKLEGIQANQHEGEPGIFELTEIFTDAPPFEVGRLWGPAWHAHLEQREAAERLRYASMLLMSQCLDLHIPSVD